MSQVSRPTNPPVLLDWYIVYTKLKGIVLCNTGTITEPNYYNTQPAYADRKPPTLQTQIVPSSSGRHTHEHKQMDKPVQVPAHQCEGSAFKKEDERLTHDTLPAKMHKPLLAPLLPVATLLEKRVGKKKCTI